MLSTYYVCYIYAFELQINFIMEANSVNPEQTASKAVWSRNMVQNQVINQMTTVVHNRRMGNIEQVYAHRRDDKDQAVYVSLSYFMHISLVLRQIDAVSSLMF